MGTKTVCAFTLVLLFIAYYGNNEVPEEVVDKWEYYFNVVACRLVADYSTIGSIVTGTDGRIFLRGVIAKAEATFPDAPEEVSAVNELIDGVEVRIYRRKDNDRPNQPCLIFIHGGGLIAASPRGYDGFSGELVKRMNITIISINYRLVPEHPSPIPLEDSMRVVLDVMYNPGKYRVNRDKIGLAGDSGGATLAGSIPIYLRDHHPEFSLRFQALLYPLLQGINLDLPSHQRNGHRGSAFTRLDKVAGVVASYIHGLDYHYTTFSQDILCQTHLEKTIPHQYKDIIGVDLLPRDLVPENYQPTQCKREINQKAVEVLQGPVLDPYNFPLMVKSLEGFPPLFMLTVQSDPLRDEGYLYVRRYQKAGLPVQHFHSQPGWHGMLNFPESNNGTIAAMNAVVDYMADMFNVKALPYEPKTAEEHVQTMNASQFALFMGIVVAAMAMFVFLASGKKEE